MTNEELERLFHSTEKLLMDLALALRVEGRATPEYSRARALHSRLVVLRDDALALNAARQPRAILPNGLVQGDADDRS
jgi:hypothetical protein